MRHYPIIFPTLQELATQVDPELAGGNGTNRATKGQLQIRANHDYEAIYCWLREYEAKATTFRVYQKEAERFLLWCIYQQKKPFSSVDRADIDAYTHFLSNPNPQNIWCARSGGRSQKRGSATWRPFVGPLSPRAKVTALSILDSLFSYLITAGYLEFNPMSLIRKRFSKDIHFQQQALTVQQRILQMDEWHALLDTLQAMPENTLGEKKEKFRLNFLIAALYFLGLRVHELTQQKWSAFRKIENYWWFFVIGKGGKPAKIPVNDNLLKAMIEYRLFLGKTPLPQENEMTPIIHSFTTGQAISERQINKLLKKLAFVAANQFSQKPEKMAKLKKFSAHWLRHLSASMQDMAGITFKHIRANLRHENDDTTRIYVHAFDEDRHHDSQKLKWR